MNSRGAPDSRRTVTLQDVAREAEVAVSTASRALSNPDRVSRPMRERIQEVAKRLGYTSGRAPVRGSLLALMVSGIANPYNAALIRGVESQARAAGSSLIVGDIADGPEAELAHLERISDRDLDGIVLASSLSARGRAAVGERPHRDRAVQPGGGRISPASSRIRATAADRSSSNSSLSAIARSRICLGRRRCGPTTNAGTASPRTRLDSASKSSGWARSCRRSTKEPLLPT